MKTLLGDLRDDLRHAGRLLRSRPVPTLLAIAALTLGVGVSTGVFSIFNAVLVHDLPYREPERLVMLYNTNDQAGFTLKQQKVQGRSLSFADYLDWRNFDAFESMIVFATSLNRMTNTDDPETAHAYRPSPGVFQMLGSTPMLGRGFTPEEEAEGVSPSVVLQYEFWQRRYRGDPSLIGKSISINNRPHRVVGVMPPGFVFFNRQMDFLVTGNFRFQGVEKFRGARYLRSMARLKRGVSLQEAQARADAYSAALAREHPETDRNWRVVLVPITEDTTSELRPAMWLLLAAVGCVLLICFANTTNLLLVQASGRFKEIAVRSALGAGSLRLLRMFLAEGFAYAIPGGALGLAFAYGLIQYFRSVRPDRFNHGKYLPQVEAIQMDPAVAAFAIGVTLLSALIFGLVPWFRASKVNLNQSLKDVGHGTTAGTDSRTMRNWLVAGQVAVTVVLVTGAALLLRSFLALYERGPGYRPDNLVCMQVEMAWEDVADEIKFKKLSREEGRKLYRAASDSFRGRLYREVEAVPGVDAVTACSTIPLSSFYQLSTFAIEGRPPDPQGREPQAIVNVVRENYFAVVGISVLAGRSFGPEDQHIESRDSPGSIVLSREFVHRYFAGQNPIGRRIRWSGRAGDNPWNTVVGVVGDLREDGMDRPPQPYLYFVDREAPWPHFVIVHSRGDTMSLMPSVRAAIRRADRRTAIYRVLAMPDIVRDSAWKLNYSMMLLGALAAIALFLAVVGVYGVLSYSVRLRTREIGMRMALGAGRLQVIWMVMRQGLSLAGAGVAGGLVLSVLLTRFLRTLLFGVAPVDIPTFGIVAVAITAAAALASLIPAVRAATVQPMVALRYE